MAKRWGEMETVTDFIFLGYKITMDCDFSQIITDPCFLEEKLFTNLESIIKSRDITLLTNIHLVKATVFPVVIY